MEDRQDPLGLLNGQFESKIEGKFRVALPRKFRSILGNRLIITQGYENAIIIVSEKNWKALLEGTEGKPFIQSEARETRRFLLGGAFDVELDHKGRFIVPAHLRNFGKIKDEVIFLGLSTYVEMWDKKRWEEYQAFLEKNIGDISQRLVNDRKEE